MAASALRLPRRMRLQILSILPIDSRRVAAIERGRGRRMREGEMKLASESARESVGARSSTLTENRAAARRWCCESREKEGKRKRQGERHTHAHGALANSHTPHRAVEVAVTRRWKARDTSPGTQTSKRDERPQRERSAAERRRDDEEAQKHKRRSAV